MNNIFTQILRRPPYLVISIVTSLIIFVFLVWLPNLRLIVTVLTSDTTLVQRLKFPISLLGSIITNFSILSATYTIAIAMLFGINITMIIFFLKRRLKNIRQTGVTIGFLGLISGIFGIGCTACGSFLLLTLLTWLGAGTLIKLLPLQGGEFGILGIFLLLLSIYLTARQINKPITCKI
ncbi:MAG: hypothetical protein UT42_C0013G0003 [Candidatus Falkowbacteria bacterium GW2011_GWA2_39_24]|uniref:Uncharacterized protein n=1 Tax=Candidatus Falkowbacteria bacterium GW2011_GWA2_39_24 TaxID=1618634 RepID=A0A0G0RMW1_9BACT|nr:MAG: hypothetical protein UT42_C0013G0003 [Candidatus Falkowbacteria bacterium GW2011_GWA2_39_24]